MGELGQFQKRISDYESSGIAIIAISVDAPEDLKSVQESTGAEYPLISDSKGILLDQFALRHVGGDPFKGGDIARPANLLVSKTGKFLWAHYADNYRVRLGPDKVLRAARAALP